MNNKPTYFEMPNFDTPPNSLIRLGQIIHDYQNPADVVAPPPAHPPLPHVPEIIISTQSDWRLSREKLVNGSVDVWTQFLASVLGIGGDASLLLEREQGDVLKFDTLETQFMAPDVEYVRAAMAAPQARRFYEDNPHAPTFMVTGVKIARGATVERLRRVKYGAEGGAGVGLMAAAGVPVTLGPKGCSDHRKWWLSVCKQCSTMLRDETEFTTAISDHGEGVLEGLVGALGAFATIAAFLFLSILQMP